MKSHETLDACLPAPIWRWTAEGGSDPPANDDRWFCEDGQVLVRVANLESVVAGSGRRCYWVHTVYVPLADRSVVSDAISVNEPVAGLLGGEFAVRIKTTSVSCNLLYRRLEAVSAI